MEQIHIGPCKCGGYGQVYNEAAEKELGKCHSDLKVIEAEKEQSKSTNEGQDNG